MCGITGYAGFDNNELLHAMCNSLLHRGPDEDGYYTAPGVGLAMRRLSIIDLKTGRQPITNETRDVWVVFNGEIYNYETLRETLISRGHKFATHSDTETIVHLYEEYGADFVHHLRGMFGIALWDVNRRRLILARDRIGEKPLYYSWDGKRLLFGSEIKAILQDKHKRQVNPQAVCDFLAAGYVAGAQTFYGDISKLPPGHLLVLEDGNINVRQYWKHDGQTTQSLSFADASDEVEKRLSEAVRLCLKSDVEVGAFLSGGIDSSVIVALMREHAAKVQTFSVGYAGKASGFNELNYAKRVADHLGTQHHELILDANSSMELLPRIIWHYDEPHGEPTSVLVYLLCEFVQKRVKVALGGTGGDELFYGYPRHVGIGYLEHYRRLPRFLRVQVVERLLRKWPESTRGSRFAKRARRFISGADLPPERAYQTWVSLFQEEVRAGLPSDIILAEAPNPAGDWFLKEHLSGIGDNTEELYRHVTTLDIEGYLAEYQLAYMDRMSMAHSLEVRSPLCDYSLTEFVTSLPRHYRLKGSRTKHILKEVAAKWIPRDIIDRKKVGFDSPIGQWFKDELRPFLQGFLSREHVSLSGILNPDKVQEIVGDHLAGRRDYSLQLWSLVALEAWHRMYIEDGITNGSDYKVTDMRGASGLGRVTSTSILQVQ